MTRSQPATAPYGHKAPKIAAEGTTLTVSNADGGKTTFPALQGQTSNFTSPAYNTIVRTLSDTVLRGKVFKGSRSTVLEGSSQVHAREVPFLAAFSQGISRFIIILIVVMTQERFAGPGACLGRQCELLKCVEDKALT
jgi:hypothetical protein